MRGDESFAYDLIAGQSRVSGRVALLLRSTERNLSAARFVTPHPLLTTVKPGRGARPGARRRGAWDLRFVSVFVVLAGGEGRVIKVQPAFAIETGRAG